MYVSLLKSIFTAIYLKSERIYEVTWTFEAQSLWKNISYFFILAFVHSGNKHFLLPASPFIDLVFFVKKEKMPLLF